MIKCKKYFISKPTAYNGDLNNVLIQINKDFESTPQCEIINIEHVISVSETTYNKNEYFICVWYNEK